MTSGHRHQARGDAPAPITPPTPWKRPAAVGGSRSAPAACRAAGALRHPVVVTIMVDIMRSVGPRSTRSSRSRRSSPVSCSATSRHYTAGPVVRPVRPQDGAAGQPAGLRHRFGGDRPVQRPDHPVIGPADPGHCQRSAVAGDPGLAADLVVGAAGRGAVGSALPRSWGPPALRHRRGVAAEHLARRPWINVLSLTPCC